MRHCDWIRCGLVFNLAVAPGLRFDIYSRSGKPLPDCNPSLERPKVAFDVLVYREIEGNLAHFLTQQKKKRRRTQITDFAPESTPRDLSPATLHAPCLGQPLSTHDRLGDHCHGVPDWRRRTLGRWHAPTRGAS